jgi:hypothetical protein
MYRAVKAVRQLFGVEIGSSAYFYFFERYFLCNKAQRFVTRDRSRPRRTLKLLKRRRKGGVIVPKETFPVQSPVNPMDINPRHINETESDRRSVKDGWYPIDATGKLGKGPFSNREDCLAHINEKPVATPCLRFTGLGVGLSE